MRIRLRFAGRKVTAPYTATTSTSPSPATENIAWSPGLIDIVAEWQSWGRVLGLPLLVAEGDGSLREPFARMGALRIEAPTWRRRRRSAIAKRRPSRLLRRRPGKLPATPIVHRGEREIIARN